MMKNSNRLMLLGGVVGLMLAAGVPVFADMGQGPKADANKDGAIDRAEFDTQRAAQFKAMDTNGDGVLTAEEMKAFHEQRRADMRDNMTGKFVTRIDTSGDGKISAAEWQANSLQKFVKLDGNGDGAVTADEFQNMHKRPDDNSGGATGKQRGDFKNGLARLDTDKDGKVSAAEWNAQGDKMFARMDDNKDGQISADEMPHRRHGDQTKTGEPLVQPN
jgi:Ca2+-binding EF-hand superfamily protein